MKIHLDGSWSDAGGIGRFSKEISRRIDNVKDIFFIKRPASFYSTLIYTKINFLLEKDDVMVLLGYIPPLFCFNKFVFTVHDLNHVDRAENSSFFKRLYYKFIIARGCRIASAVLTVSDFSKKRIIEWAGISPEKVINIGNGVDVSFSNEVIAYKPGYPYLICVSNRKLHKNESRLLKAFSESNIDSEVRLLFTGRENNEVLMMIKTLRLEDRVVFCGRVSDQELPSLYRGALGLLFPSLYEGFGLPVVEAMASGIPVLTSNTTSLPEVAGDAALLVNPESIDEIRVGIERLVHDEALRTELIAKGLERAKLFSWDAVAKRVQDVLDEVVKA
ncbi:glycosyltransferase family 4 protein [Aeromonas mytilicola]